MTDTVWDLVVAAPARRAIDRLPAKIALAVVEFLLVPLGENPYRVGKPLRGDLADLHLARVGVYRVVYEIDEASHTVEVLDVDHPANIYRPG